MAFRLDRGSLRRPERLPDGRLRVDGVLTRTGVFEYRDHDGTLRREYRPPEEVFNTDSVATFEDVPFTDDHPPEAVTAANARQYAVGMVRDVRAEGEQMIARIVVNDAATVAKLEAGKVALSCGYEVDLEMTAGVTPAGERYDAIQRHIRGNHVALVAIGRAGPSARVRMDCATMSGEDAPPPTETHDMDLKELQAALAAANEKAATEKVRADGAEAALKTAADAHAATLATVAAERDAAKAAAAKAEAARTDAANGEAARVRARIDLERKASPILGDTLKPEMTEREIRVAVVKRVDAEEIPADAHDEYVRARFELACKASAAGASALSQVRTVAGAARGDATEKFDESEARKKMERENAGAWMTATGEEK